MLKIILEIEGTSSLQGVPNQNQDTAIGHIIRELLYHSRMFFFSLENLIIKRYFKVIRSIMWLRSMEFIIQLP